MSSSYLLLQNIVGINKIPQIYRNYQVIEFNFSCIEEIDSNAKPDMHEETSIREQIKRFASRLLSLVLGQ